MHKYIHQKVKLSLQRFPLCPTCVSKCWMLTSQEGKYPFSFPTHEFMILVGVNTDALSLLSYLGNTGEYRWACCCHIHLIALTFKKKKKKKVTSADRNVIIAIFCHSYSPQLLDGLDVLQRNTLTSLKQEFIAHSVIGIYRNLTAQDFTRLGMAVEAICICMLLHLHICYEVTWMYKILCCVIYIILHNIINS